MVELSQGIIFTIFSNAKENMEIYWTSIKIGVTYGYTKHEVVKQIDAMAMTLTENEICVEWLHENCYLEDVNNLW